MRTWVAIVLAATVVVALALRLPMLGERPMHNDEAVNGIKIAKLLDTGSYVYDPDEHHGPSLYYFSAGLLRLMGVREGVAITEANLRLLTVLFGVALLLLLPLTQSALGFRGTLWGAIFLAVSPAMVFYSRYYIHEMLLVFFTGLALGAGWQYWKTRKIGWALLAGLAIGFMDASKETFVITLIAAILALLTNQAWNRWVDASGAPVKAPRLNWWHLLAGTGVWLITAILLFSSFFANASGPLDSIRSYLPWLNRAAGDSPHIHPWHFYFTRLLYFQAESKGVIWTESLILGLAVLGGTAGFMRKKLGTANPSFIRFLALYAFAQTCAYTILAYKTPWCLLNFWHPLILLAGVGSSVLVRFARRAPWTWGVRLLILVGGAHLGWQAWALSTRYADDQRNPYVYAHTSAHVMGMVKRIQQLGSVAPAKHQTVIKVVAPDDDYWPLPWYLRNFRNVGYYSALPADPFAPIMVVSSRLDARLDEQRTHLMVGYFQLRPKVFVELYVQIDLWKQWLEAFPPPKDPEED